MAVPIRAGIISLGCLPTVLLLIPVLLSLWNVRKCFPGVCSCVLFIFGLLYGFLGVLLLTIGVAATVTCGELELFDSYQPGVILWWGVPKCQETLDIKTIMDTIEEVDVDTAKKVCNKVRAHCSNSMNYNPLQRSSILICAPDFAMSSECGTMATANEAIRELPLKTGLDDFCNNCFKFQDCIDRCRESTKASFGNFEKDLSRAITANNAIRALLPLIQCKSIITQLRLVLRYCDDISVSLLCIGVGSSLAAVLCILGIIVLLKGSKVFFDRAAMTRSSQGIGLFIADAENVGDGQKADGTEPTNSQRRAPAKKRTPQGLRGTRHRAAEKMSN